MLAAPAGSTGSRHFSLVAGRFCVELPAVLAAPAGSTGSGTWAAVAVHGLSCSTARGVFPDQGLNPCLLHWQVDS